MSVRLTHCCLCTYVSYKCQVSTHKFPVIMLGVVGSTP